LASLRYKEITGGIIGCAMEVHRCIGRGFQEYIYQRALEIEFNKAGLACKREFDIPVYYKNDQVGLRRVDFLVNDIICVEIKAVSTLEDVHLAQALNYLEASRREVGLLINFGGASLQFKRLQMRDKKNIIPNNPNQNPPNRGSIAAFIPARYAATRFPAKLMQILGDKTVIRHTYENTLATGLFDSVFVVTDSDIIYHEINSTGGKAIMSKKEHESGSDRIAEAAADLDIDIIVNVQGDEPFVKRAPLEKLLRVFEGEEGRNVQVASLMQVMTEDAFISDPNYVKVTVDRRMNSLMFSRSVIPYPRSKNDTTVYYEHIGVYAFRKQALLNFTNWPVTPLEATEKIECLRYLENGIPLKMVVTEYMGIEIDTPEDLARAATLL
jgi:3-deoxy-manno-octulosonate cytidylyltransferase (CMP-KDO synthetase)